MEKTYVITKRFMLSPGYEVIDGFKAYDYQVREMFFSWAYEYFTDKRRWHKHLKVERVEDKTGTYLIDKDREIIMYKGDNCIVYKNYEINVFELNKYYQINNYNVELKKDK